jgi:hypothetical protein
MYTSAVVTLGGVQVPVLGERTQPAVILSHMVVVIAVCVCVFLASGYEWVTVMHEIPISSAQSMTSFHTLGLSSTIPLVPLERGLYHMRRFQRVCSILDWTPWQLLGGQFHNLGSSPCHNIAKYGQPWYTHWYVLWLARGFTPQH